jgi:hypothetical protein
MGDEKKKKRKRRRRSSPFGQLHRVVGALFSGARRVHVGDNFLSPLATGSFWRKLAGINGMLSTVTTCVFMRAAQLEDLRFKKPNGSKKPNVICLPLP